MNMQINSVGIIGYGAFGKHIETLLHKFAPAVKVKVFSRRYEPDGDKFYTAEETCTADAVVFCCSISNFESELKELLPHVPEGTVIVDVATVKKHTSDLLKQLAGERPFISTHPMFGPESFKKTNGDVSGFRIVVTEKVIPDNSYQQLREFLSSCGFVVIEMTADEHDKLLADTLFLTHYIGQTMQTAGFMRTNIDTVSFQSLMNAVESVAHDGKLFMDVYNYNPYCEEAAVRFHEAQKVVLEALLKKNK